MERVTRKLSKRRQAHKGGGKFAPVNRRNSLRPKSTLTGGSEATSPESRINTLNTASLSWLMEVPGFEYAALRARYLTCTYLRLPWEKVRTSIHSGWTCNRQQSNVRSMANFFVVFHCVDEFAGCRRLQFTKTTLRFDLPTIFTNSILQKPWEYSMFNALTASKDKELGIEGNFTRR